jgi:hypothetical protein
MDIKRKYSDDVEKQINQLQEMINSIKERYDKKIGKYMKGDIYDPKYIGHLQIMYLSEIKPYQKQIECLVQNSKYEHIVVIHKDVNIDVEALKKMEAPIFNCLGVPKKLQ